jgi:hypothetical protein
MKNRIKPAPKASGKPEGKTAAKSRDGELQVASGDSKATGQPQAPQLTKSIGPVGIPQIQRFTLIPDFRTRTAAPHPIVISTPTKGFFCIDGWEMVEEAREQNHSSIVCETYHARSDSKTEIALHKAAMRSKPQGGTCSHAEMVGITVLLFGMLMESGENLEVFSHGGARRGTGFTKAREEDAIIILAERLGKSRKTILKNLQHGEYLNEQALNAVVEADVPKGIFEAVQSQKQRQVGELIAAQKTPEEITEAVSAQMSLWLKDFSGQNAGDSPGSDGIKGHRKADPKPGKVKIFKHHIGSDSGTASPAEPQNIRCDIMRIGETLSKAAGNSSVTEQKLAEIVHGVITELAQIFQQLRQQSGRAGNGGGN